MARQGFRRQEHLRERAYCDDRRDGYRRARSLGPLRGSARSMPASSANRTASIRPFVLGVIDRFGVDRVMFGSNFPVDKLYGSFDTLYCSFESIVASFSESEQDQLFRGNVLRHYRLRAEA